MNLQATKQKYRPVLTAPQITQIIELAKLDYANLSSPTRDISWSLITTLSPFKTKIELDSIAPAYTTTAISSEAKQAALLAELGATQDEIPKIAVEELTKEQYWQYCYDKYQNLGIGALNPQEIEGVHEHKYLHGLMSSTEVAAFEDSILGKIYN